MSATKRISMVFLAMAAVGWETARAQSPEGGTNAPVPVMRVEPQPYRLDNRRVQAAAADFARLRDVATRQRTVKAIVGLQVFFTPEGGLAGDAAALQREQIAAARTRLVAALQGTSFSVRRTYRSTPAVALELSAQALDALERSRQAATIKEDAVAQVTLAKSSAVTEATEATLLGRGGQGQYIAVIDTGVDAAHPFFRTSALGPSKVTHEACFSYGLNCPNGAATQTGAGAGAPCTFDVNCDHGTHVAGIAAGKDTASLGFQGVAPEAKLIAINVFTNYNGGLGAYFSDIIAALDYVHDLATSTSSPLPVASVNMSLGTGYNFATDCDVNFPMEKTAIDNLRSVGVATVISSGNNGNNAGMSAPGCISTAITVGATDQNMPTEYVHWFSNSTSQVELLAPGDTVNSSVPGGGFAKKSGTSMAAPHVAGAWAVLKQLDPAANVSTVLSHLEITGKPLTDGDNNVTKPRIRVLSASVRIADTGFVDGETFTGNGSMGMVSNGAGLATRTGGSGTGAITISGIPGGSSIVAAYLYWMTLGGPNDTIVFQGLQRKGTLIGASHNTCWPSINPMGANRTYRAKITGIAGNGTYTVNGLGSFGMDGQGASLVIVYQPAYYEFPATMRVIKIRHGAMTLNSVGPTMTNVFSNLQVPKQPSAAELHVGMGDAEPYFWEGSMMFNGTALNPLYSFTGTDGPMWDAMTLPVPVSLLPAGTTSPPNSISLVGGIADCLCWSYSALSYKYSNGTVQGNLGN